MSGPYAITEAEYDEIDEAIASTPKGRAYLRLRDKRTRAGGAPDPNDLVEKFRAELRALPAGAGAAVPEAQVAVLRRELQAMSNCIHQTRLQIAELHPAESGNSRIIAATNELDAIVSACERATSEILNAAERISEIVHEDAPTRDSAALAAEIDRHVTEILTACSFQDITGQRTTKVVNTLRYIEMRIDSMIQIWGAEGSGPVAAPLPDPTEDTRADAHLLNGPALDGGVRQEDIDAFFEGGPTPPPPPEPEPPVEAKAKVAAAPRKPKPAPKPEAMPTVDIAPSATASQADIDALFA